LDPAGRRWHQDGEDCVVKCFITYASPNIIRVTKSRRVRWTGHVARTEGMRNSCIILIRKPDWKRSLEDVGVDGGNIIMGLREVGWEAVDWLHLAQDMD